MNSCTIARKLDVSVVRTVVGALLEALVLFFVFRVATVLVCPPRASVVVDEGCGLGMGLVELG